MWYGWLQRKVEDGIYGVVVLVGLDEVIKTKF